MYAVIRAGGKQHKVAQGDVIEVERTSGDDLEFTPLMVVDDDGNVKAGAADLADAKVTARVIGETKGEKVRIFKYRNKTRYRRRAGHRQKYTTIEISGIQLPGKRSRKKEEAKDGS